MSHTLKAADLQATLTAAPEAAATPLARPPQVGRVMGLSARPTTR